MHTLKPIKIIVIDFLIVVIIAVLFQSAHTKY